ncbi:MAG TPA: hypothetical protein VKY92_20370 [Verrucomicrobiae bacterium]|nr:hypothetical protein [Verrucomicrobiae bacterium]
MKRNLTILLTTVGLAGALFGGLTLAHGQSAAAGTEERHEGRERHPAIHKAILALEAARGDLQKANHDFGGHRKEALEECDKAIAQLKLALQYDKR